jgi:hypothetical protein
MADIGSNSTRHLSIYTDPPLSIRMNFLVRIMNRFRTCSRQLKLDFFFEATHPEYGDRVLDIGGGWGLFLQVFLERGLQAIVVDVDLASLRSIRVHHPGVPLVLASGTDLPFKDNAFQTVFSNAVIEHVGRWAAQTRFASEVGRVGRSYFVCTPNKLFPFEFHYGLPAYQFVPRPVQRFLARHCRLGLWYDRERWEDIRLLTRRQLAGLFPGGKVFGLRVTFMSETLIAVKSPALTKENQHG